MALNAGDLRHKVMIQEPVEAPDKFGQPVLSWKDVAERRAAVEPLAGRELFLAQQVRPDVTHRVRMRYRSGMAPRLRLLFCGRVLNIRSVINVMERNEELELICQEEV